MNLSDFRGVAVFGDQLGKRHVKRELFDPTHVIDGEGVVHVEPHQLDPAHPKVAIDEDLPSPFDFAALAGAGEQSGQLRIREHLLGAALRVDQ